MSNRKESQLRCGLILLCPIWFGLLASSLSSKLSACDEDKLLPFPSVRFPWTFHFLGVCCLNSLLPKERHQCLFTAPQDTPASKLPWLSQSLPCSPHKLRHQAWFLRVLVSSLTSDLSELPLPHLERGLRRACKTSPVRDSLEWSWLGHIQAR